LRLATLFVCVVGWLAPQPAWAQPQSAETAQAEVDVGASEASAEGEGSAASTETPDAHPPASLDADEEVDPDWNAGPVSAAARRMLDRVRASVVRIRGFYGANRAEAFHGTAFAVAPHGTLLTNYHVIARAALSPDGYRLQYATEDGTAGSLAILAVDVAHDLALVRSESLEAPPLQLRTGTPPQGDRLYTVGYPLNLGLVITEGIGNRLIDNPFRPRLHYAGPMNPGMSGGPALDSRGRVVGINVAFSTRGQLVSFLVPTEFVAPILEAARTPLDAGSIRSEVAKQLSSHQAAVLSALPVSFPVEVAAGYALPAELAPFVDCTAVAGAPPVRGLRVQSVACRADVGLSVEPGLQSGDFRFSHSVLVSDGLADLQFAEQLRRVAAAAGSTARAPEHVNPYACKQDRVNLDRFQAAVTLCARSYRFYEGLYDVMLVVVSANQPQRGFVSTATLRGVDFAGGMQFTRRYLQAMRWTR
jgi:S1-C subfamily serine protease